MKKTHQKKILFSPKLLAKIVFADPMVDDGSAGSYSQQLLVWMH
jgi:hypothetical protein